VQSLDAPARALESVGLARYHTHWIWWAWTALFVAPDFPNLELGESGFDFGPEEPNRFTTQAWCMGSSAGASFVDHPR
jgi:hypothetical protein